MLIGRVLTCFCAVAVLWATGCDQRRPIAVASSNGPAPASLSYPEWAVTEEHAPILPYDNPLTTEGIALGRRLFYEKALSRDGDIACSSCHVQQHAFSDPRRYSTGVRDRQGSRNAMALVNLAWNHFFFWDARGLTLELQAFEPVRDHREQFNEWSEVVQRLKEQPDYEEHFQRAFGTMDFDSLHVVYALAQFERTLTSFDSPFDRFHYGCDSTALTAAQVRGKDLFFGRAHCADCHGLPLFQDHAVANIGLDSLITDPGLGGVSGKAWHMGRFKTPTLRNCAVSGPYMHDGRFATLADVVDFYADGVHLNTPNFDDHLYAWKLGVVHLDHEDRKDLVQFLEALTDTTFHTEPAFGPPLD